MPVSDVGAAVFTTELYRSLSVGHGINEAVQNARNEIVNRYQYHAWPLLRIFTDGTSLAPIIDKGQKLKYHTAKAATVQYLEGAAVKILTEGFIGRRREVQRGIRALKGVDGKYGAIIHGTAGNGKSCLAGKLIDRFRGRDNNVVCKDSTCKELIAIHGVAREVDIVRELQVLFDRKGNEEALNILKADDEYEVKIKALFRGPLVEVPTIIYFDDFEQNLELDHNGNGHVMKPEPLEAVRPLLTAVDWAGHSSVILITSRYPFKLVVGGKDIPAAKLEQIPLMAFKDADLEKKVAELVYLNESDNRELYLKYGGGNPRLLEWFDLIAKDEKKYDIAALESAIKGKSEEFIQIYFAEVIAATVGEKFEGFLRRAAVYRVPVKTKAFKYLGERKHLERGIALTLLEREMVGDGKSFYWVTPIIREMQWDKLEADEKMQIHGLAFDWFDEEIGNSEKLEPKLLEEAVYHGLESGNVRRACRHAVDLGNYLDKLIRYRDKLSIQGKVADKITKDVINEAIAEKDVDVAILLNNYGSTLQAMGQSRQGIDFMQKALDIYLSALGDKHPNVAGGYNNIGAAWDSLGQYEKAIAFYQKALDIDLPALGDKHPNVARDFNNIGLVWSALGEYEKAIAFYQKALEIDLQAFGENHPNVATVYNNIGLTWSALEEYEKAIGFYQKAMNILTDVFGNTHPTTQKVKENLEIAIRELNSPLALVHG
ncbi:MAG: tetratricopeptide repeat protein [Nitrospirae bacterium]|nr:tetratricopeptide repeat protein [Nitrospirota bacterium]